MLKTVDVKINKEAREVYSYLSKMENLPYWTNIRSVQSVSGNGEVGSQYALSSNKFMSRETVVVEIVDREIPYHFSYRDTSSSVGNKMGFRFMEENGVTVVRGYRDVDVGVVASVLTLDFLTSRDSLREIEASLEMLKKILEL